MNRNKKISVKTSLLAWALVVGQILYVTPLAVLAQAATVRLAGQAVITNIAGSGATSADRRAETVQQNLDNALVASKDRTPGAVNIQYVKGLPVITLGGYQVITVDDQSARSAGTSPARLAEKWANSIREALKDQRSVQSYVAHLSGDYKDNAPSVAAAPPPPQRDYNQDLYAGNTQTPPPRYGAEARYDARSPQYGARPPQYGGAANYGRPAYNPPPRGFRHQGRVVYAPAGLVLPATLTTSITSQLAKPGDVIQANVSQAVMVGDSQIPMGSVLLGQVTEAKGGRRLGLAGRLAVQFTRLRTPDGTETPISAHLVGGIGKYDERSDGTMAGETWKRKTVQAGVRGAAGAGLGAALGTAVGAIAGGSRGAGRGAWSGTAIGGGLGLGTSLLARKGRDVTIPSGTPIKVQLDAPVSIAGGGAGPYVGAY